VVPINVGLAEGWNWKTWTNENDVLLGFNLVERNRGISITMPNNAVEMLAQSNQRSIKIEVWLNAHVWDDQHPMQPMLPVYTESLSIRNKATGIFYPVHITMGAAGVVPGGDYYIYAGGVNTNQSMYVPANGDAVGKLRYYTLTAIAGQNTSGAAITVPVHVSSSAAITVTNNLPPNTAIMILLPDTPADVTVNALGNEFQGWASTYANISGLNNIDIGLTMPHHEVTVTAYATLPVVVNITRVLVSERGSEIYVSPPPIAFYIGDTRVGDEHALLPDGQYTVRLVHPDGGPPLDIIVIINGTDVTYVNSSNQTISPVIYYYELTLVNETGTAAARMDFAHTPYVGNTLTDGRVGVRYSFRAGVNINIASGLVAEHQWIHWESDDDRDNPPIQGNIIARNTSLNMPPIPLTLTAYAAPAFEVIISLTLNDEPWSGDPGLFLVVQGGDPNNPDDVITDLTLVPPGVYYIYDKDGNTGNTVTVLPDGTIIFGGTYVDDPSNPSTPASLTIPYYLLILEGDAGILSTHGAGEYRATVAVPVSAVVRPLYDWRNWTQKDPAGIAFNHMLPVHTLNMPAHALTLIANTTLQDTGGTGSGSGGGDYQGGSYIPAPVFTPSATTPPVITAPTVTAPDDEIIVYLDNQPWVNHPITNLDDINNLPPGSTTNIYDDLGNTGYTVTINDDGSITLRNPAGQIVNDINYYSVTLVLLDENGNEISRRIVAAHTLGREVNIAALLASGYVWESWWAGAYIPVDNAITTMPMPAHNMILTARRVASHLYTRLDDVYWYNAPHYLFVNPNDPNNPLVLSLENANLLPVGTYRVYDNVGFTGFTVQVDENGNVTMRNADGVSVQHINYYTLTLVADASTHSLTGGGIYLAGRNVNITALLEEGYSWAGWREGTQWYNRSQNADFNMPHRSMILTATASISPITGDTSAVGWAFAVFFLAAISFAVLWKINRKKISA
jgi:hypothetical protein